MGWQQIEGITLLSRVLESIQFVGLENDLFRVSVSKSETDVCDQTTLGLSPDSTANRSSFPDP
jgi:hypothetical protein